MDNQGAPEGTGNSGRTEGLDLRLHVLPVVFLTVVFFLNFISRVILSPLVPSVEADLGLGHGAVGSFFLFITAGYFVSLLGSGFISSRITHCSTIILSLAAVGCAMILVSFAGSARTIALGMFCIGLATGFYLPSGIAAITDLVHPSRWGKALAIHEFAPNMAFLMAPLVAGGAFGFFIMARGDGGNRWCRSPGVCFLRSCLPGGGFLRSEAGPALRPRALQGPLISDYHRPLFSGDWEHDRRVLYAPALSRR